MYRTLPGILFGIEKHRKAWNNSSCCPGLDNYVKQKKLKMENICFSTLFSFFHFLQKKRKINPMVDICQIVTLFLAFFFMF